MDRCVCVCVCVCVFKMYRDWSVFPKQKGKMNRNFNFPQTYLHNVQPNYCRVFSVGRAKSEIKLLRISFNILHNFNSYAWDEFSVLKRKRKSRSELGLMRMGDHTIAHFFVSLKSADQNHRDRSKCLHVYLYKLLSSAHIFIYIKS